MKKLFAAGLALALFTPALAQAQHVSGATAQMEVTSSIYSGKKAPAKSHKAVNNPKKAKKPAGKHSAAKKAMRAAH